MSQLVWGVIGSKVDTNWESIEEMHSRRVVLHETADNRTGTLSVEDAVDVYQVVKLFNPKVIVEVGTYIGISTEAMRIAAPDATIYTCDMSNDIDVSLDANIIQYPKQTSHQMFEDLAAKGVKADFVYLDGRLSASDVEPLGKIVHERTVFMLDDFEGVEKGVSNAMLISHANWMLVYPQIDGGKTAIMIPHPLLQFVPQEAV